LQKPRFLKQIHNLLAIKIFDYFANRWRGDDSGEEDSRMSSFIQDNKKMAQQIGRDYCSLMLCSALPRQADDIDGPRKRHGQQIDRHSQITPFVFCRVIT